MRRPLLPLRVPSLRGAAALRLFLCVLGLLCVLASPCFAGGGPETVLLVVNADSPASLQVANHYVALRDIPRTHVCALHGVPNLMVIDVDTFRERIWQPIETYILRHGLAREIDVIAYSVDFPFAVNFQSDFKGVDLPGTTGKPPQGSLTGMTYMIHAVKQKSPAYVSLTSNWYFRETPKGNLPSQGFRGRYGWVPNQAEPQRDPAEAMKAPRYLLSTMLGFTGMQGNTVPEVLACLDRAAACDGTHPDGTVYLMANGDIRAKTRMDQVDEVVAALEKRKHSVMVMTAGRYNQNRRVPLRARDVIGCMAGTPTFEWPTVSRMLPGAIAEHLTSFGARFDGSGQTKISEFIRNGAAGSSGAVAEPYALWPKFPRARMHVYYADGCSLAESFYQSLFGPYQLLILGDPLARPYATFADVALETPKDPIRGTIALEPRIKMPPEQKARTVEVWVDGKLVSENLPDAPLTLDTTKLVDGAHDLRIVVVEDSTIETRSYASRPLRVQNGTSNVTLLVGPEDSIVYGNTVRLTGAVSGAQVVVVLAGDTVLAIAQVADGLWKAEIDTKRLGVGTVRLQAGATFRDGARALSGFRDLEIRPPEVAAASAEPEVETQAGLLATVTDAENKEHTFPVSIVGAQGEQRFLKALQETVNGRPKRIRLDGAMRASVDGLYRLAINAAGDLEIALDGKKTFAQEGLAMDRQAYAACALAKGWHRIHVAYTPSGNGDLSIWLGGATVSAPLAGDALRHP